jgi:hypothetical protein
MTVRFNYQLLLEVMNRDKATLDLKVYTEHSKLNSKIKIQGKCQCENDFSKSFSRCYHNGGMYCKTCTTLNWVKKLGDALEKTTGKRNASFVEEYNQQKKDTLKKSTGYEYSFQNPDTKEKSKKTLKETTGYEYSMMNPETKEKHKQTLKDRTGYENPMQNPETKEKAIQTNIDRLGVPNVMQSSDIQDKWLKSCYNKKEFQMPSGDIRIVQGYEPQALSLLLESYKEDDIVTGATNVPEIWYTTDKKRRHYVDIYIKSINTCIEIKSTWTYDKQKEEIHIKQQAAKDLGMGYEIWILNDKREILNKLT